MFGHLKKTLLIVYIFVIVFNFVHMYCTIKFKHMFFFSEHCDFLLNSFIYYIFVKMYYLLNN